MVAHSVASLTAAIKGSHQGADVVWGTFYDIRRYGGLQIFLRALLGTGSLVLSNAGETPADHLLRLGVHNVTHLTGTPSHWRRALMSPAAGAIAPRYWADFIVFEDLQNLIVRQTYKKGILVAENGKYLGPPAAPVPPPRSTMNVRYRAPRDFEVLSDSAAKIRVIEIVPNQIVTRQSIETPLNQNGQIVTDRERDILKLVVLERHRATGNVGVGFVRGFKLKTGALGSTVAHDAHNIVIVGVNEYVEPDEKIDIPILYIGDEAEEQQTAALEELRRTRDNKATTRTLQSLTAAARRAPGEANLMEKILDAARAYATEGEIRNAMREVFGDYVESPEF